MESRSLRLLPEFETANNSFARTTVPHVLVNRTADSRGWAAVSTPPLPRVAIPDDCESSEGPALPICRWAISDKSGCIPAIFRFPPKLDVGPVELVIVFARTYKTAAFR